jgi:hypothetical protein
VSVATGWEMTLYMQWSVCNLGGKAKIVEVTKAKKLQDMLAALDRQDV